MTTFIQKSQTKKINLLSPIQNWLDNIEIQEKQTAKNIVNLIPAQCPFARTIQIRERVILKIPPLCKLNPLYEQLIALRFRALCYLADNCGEDITPYCS